MCFWSKVGTVSSHNEVLFENRIQIDLLAEHLFPIEIAVLRVTPHMFVIYLIVSYCISIKGLVWFPNHPIIPVNLGQTHFAPWLFLYIEWIGSPRSTVGSYIHDLHFGNVWLMCIFRSHLHGHGSCVFSICLQHSSCVCKCKSRSP